MLRPIALNAIRQHLQTACGILSPRFRQDAEHLLRVPGLLPLAVLARTNEPEHLLASVADSVMQLAPETKQRELLSCAAVLAGLRFDDKLISQFFPEEIMEESVIYQKIFHRGELKGELKGELRGALRTVRRLLTHRFGQLAPEIERRLAELNLGALEALSDALLDFQQVSELSDWLDRYEGSRGA